MPTFHVAIIPIGKIDLAEVEAAALRVAKVVRQPLELREPIAVPRGAEDIDRGQHRAAVLLQALRDQVPKLRPGRLIGSDDPQAKTPLKVDAYVFVTDVDLFTASTDGATAALRSPLQAAIVSVRRLREAFWRRKADPVKQRARLVKEMVRMWGRLYGAPECVQAACALAPTARLPDLDTKDEAYCRGCAQRIFEGRLRI